jgi:hypothetical protein
VRNARAAACNRVVQVPNRGACLFAVGRLMVAKDIAQIDADWKLYQNCSGENALGGPFRQFHG